MPKSKRNKQVELSKTKKRGKERRQHLYDEIRSSVDTYAHLFMFSVNDMRNSKMKNVRDQWKHSRFFIGKSKLMALALGRSKEEEYRPNLHEISTRLKGQKGLLFSDRPVDEVSKWFQSFSEGDFARSGNIATETVSLSEGPLIQFAHSLEAYLRQLGLPTTLNKGVVHLIQDHVVCKAGDQLSPETAKILRLLGYEMAEFQIKIESVWSQDGSFLDYRTGSDSNENISADNCVSFMKEGFEVSKDVAGSSDDEMEVTEINAVDSKINGTNVTEEESDDPAMPPDSESTDKIEKSNEDNLGSSAEVTNEKKDNPVDSESDTEAAAELTEELNPQPTHAKELDSNTEKIIDTASILKSTKKKIKEHQATTPPKYSPKLTRERAAAASAKKDISKAPALRSNPVKKVTKRKSRVNKDDA